MVWYEVHIICDNDREDHAWIRSHWVGGGEDLTKRIQISVVISSINSGNTLQQLMFLVGRLLHDSWLLIVNEAGDDFGFLFWGASFNILNNIVLLWPLRLQWDPAVDMVLCLTNYD